MAGPLLLAGCFATDGMRGGDGGAASAEVDAAGLDAAADDRLDAQAPDAAADVMHRGTRFEPSPVVCTDGDHGEPRPERVKATTRGLEEALTDRCDEDGNLIDHRCEILPSTDCEPCQGECPPCVEHTGRVVERPFDCSGACVDGACVNWCPDQGDSLTVTHDTAADALHVDNLTKTRSYTCTPHAFDEAHCFELAGYRRDVVYGFSTDCYGDAPQVLWLPWESASLATMCAQDCTQNVAP